ncbi:MAG: SpoIID/LytB domain-containing protein [Calditrichia bacterium]
MRHLLLLFIFFTLAAFIVSCGTTSPVRQPVQRGETVPRINVLLNENPIQNITFHGDFTLYASEGRYQLSASSMTYFCLFQNNQLMMQSDSRSFRFSTGFPLRIVPNSNDAYIEIDGKRVAGVLLIHKIGEDNIAYILNTDIEHYLLGVVPAEIPSGKKEYEQAVAAQAIAARSYTYHQYLQRKNHLFQLYDDQRDQVLGDMLRYNDIVEKSIRETRGLILAGNNDSFIPYYHSTCGGFFSMVSDDTIFLPDTIAGHHSAFCSISPLFRWYRILSIEDLLKSLKKNNIFSPGPDFEHRDHHIQLKIDHREHTGRIRKMEIIIDNQRIPLRDYQIRSTFIDSLQSPLPSTWFLMAPYSADSLKFIVAGAGYGHGRGMCQWGAIGMSIKGFSFKEILNHYYPDAILRRIYR